MQIISREMISSWLQLKENKSVFYPGFPQAAEPDRWNTENFPVVCVASGDSFASDLELDPS